jgi:RNA polymerase sigma-70 factor, ECF subfamily
VNDRSPTPPADERDDRGERDAATIELLRAGDPEGIRRLLLHHGGEVLAALQRAFGSYLTSHEVDEAVEAAIVRIWITPVGALPVQATLRSWLYVIARNCGLSLVRRRRRQRKELPLDEFEDMIASMAAGRAEQDRLRRIADLQNCLRELPPMQRTVLQADLDANGTAPVEALAARLRTTSRVIYVARSRGRAEVRRMMQRLGHYAGEGPEPRPATRPEPEFG